MPEIPIFIHTGLEHTPCCVTVDCLSEILSEDRLRGMGKMENCERREMRKTRDAIAAGLETRFCPPLEPDSLGFSLNLDTPTLAFGRVTPN